MKSFQTLLNIFLVLALVGVVVFSRIEKNEVLESYRVEKERVVRDAGRSLERLEKEILAERETRKAIEAQIIALEQSSRKADSTTTYWKKRYLNEKNKNYGAFTDIQYDSLLSSLYPTRK